MNPATLAAILLSSAALLPGCIGTEAVPGEPADTSSTDSAAGDPPAAAMANADDAVAAQPTEPAPLALVEVPIVFDGAFATGAWVCEWETLQECQGAEAPGSGGETMFAPELPGPPVAGSLVLTWEATSPLMEELMFGIMAMIETEEGMEHPLEMFVSGTSPLTIEFADAQVPSEAMVHIMVHVPSQTPDPIYTAVSSEQAIHIEGTITAMPMEGMAGMDHMGH